MKTGLVLLFCVVASAGAGAAQTVNGPGDDVLCGNYTPPRLLTADQLRNRPDQKFPQPAPLPQPGHRSPHSYRSVSQELRILPDGTRICGVPFISAFYIDSSGRMRNESNFDTAGLDGKRIPTRARIEDPVAGTLYYLDLVKHTAYRLHPPPFRPPPPNDRGVRQPFPAITPNSQNLGIHMFDGLPVEGMLYTYTAIPSGGSQPISTTTETWAFRDADGGSTTLLTKNSSPTTQRTTAMLNFSTADPDPSLFRVPDGWNVVEAQVRQPSPSNGGPAYAADGFHYYIRAGGTTYEYVVQDAPYSAERITERTNAILKTSVQEAPLKLYRDSAGRMRIDRQLTQYYGDKVPAPLFSEITDPVDGVLIVLDPTHRIAHRFALGPMEQSPRLNFFTGSNPRGTLYSEKDLGEDSLEGVPVSGELRTWRTPAGIDGNDREYTQTSETWYSTKLKVIILEKTHGATEDTVIRLTRLSQEEPDHSLFEIPAGYTVVDEKGTVAITVVQP